MSEVTTWDGVTPIRYIESPEDRAKHKADDLAWAWRNWAVESCVEFNGGHAWRFRLDYGTPEVYCSHGKCPAVMDDVYFGGMEIADIDLPVTIEPWSRQGYWGEWDGGVNLTIDLTRLDEG